MIVFPIIMPYKYNNLHISNFLKKNLANLGIISFFIIYFLIGFNIYKDFGISTDEPFQRTSGHYWHLWIIENLFPRYDGLSSLSENFKKMDWSKSMLGGMFIQYGVVFDLICAVGENIFQVNGKQNIYFFRHFLNFFFFFLSSIYFFHLIRFRFNDKFLALLGTVLYITSPRIFAESFYNSKDLVFMSFVVPALYYCLKSLDQYKTKDIVIFAFFSAIATDIRIMGIFLIFLFLFFFIIEYLENKKFIKNKIHILLVLITTYLLFTYLFWPYLWKDPLNNIFLTFNYFKNFDLWKNSVFYLGEFHKGSNLPWHYIFTWIGVTIPLNHLFLFIVGSLVIIKKIFGNFLKIDSNFKNKLWKNSDQKFDFFMLAFFLIPPLTIIAFNSTIYGGWRHLYFIFPGIIYVSTFTVNYLISISTKNWKYFIIGAVCLSVLFNIKTIINLHPYQNVFFNTLVKSRANQLFEVDYWGLGNAEAIRFMINNTNDKKIYTVRTASYTTLSYSKKIINDKRISKLKFTGTTNLNQDFIFTNYIYEKDPRFEKKYFIPISYEKIYTLKKGGIIINEIFKKK